MYTHNTCIYIYIYIYMAENALRSIAVYSRRGRQQMFTSKCHFKAQISQGLGPSLQIELLKTGRSTPCHVHV